MSPRTFLLTLCLCTPAAAQSITVPGHTAYLSPDQGGARVVADKGVMRWHDAGTKILWYGQFNKTGDLRVSLSLSPASNGRWPLQIRVAEQPRDASVNGQQGERQTVDFGSFTITKPGYHCLELSCLNEGKQPALDVESLIVSGTAAQDAHFNLKPRRNAASVHLAYPIERTAQVSAFYCEMTGLEDPIWSYYMACGWHRGYFGMQVNSPSERRIIFSVWDSGGEAVDRNKVDDENRVKLVAKGDGVYSGSFGNEGTGGHSHLKFSWKTGERQRFLVTADPVDENHTVYAGYYFRRDLGEWMLISSWKAPKEGKYMRGLYSFSENFVGRNGHVVRRALYGNQWIRTADGRWRELTRVTFSHDATGKSDRRDRFMGLEDGQFFLSHGGFLDGYTKYGTPFDRPPTGRSPADMKLPALPAARATR